MCGRAGAGSGRGCAPTRGLLSVWLPLQSADTDGPRHARLPCWPRASCVPFRPALRPQRARPVGWAGGGIVWLRSVHLWPRVGTCLVRGCFVRASRLERSEGGRFQELLLGVRAPRDVSCPALALGAAGRRPLSTARAALTPRLPLGPGSRGSELKPVTWL